eukprot:g6240.t1
MSTLELAAGVGLTCYLTVVCIGCSFLLARFRSRADDLKIRARSPDLATFPAAYAIVVGGLLIPLQELLQLCGVGYPCVLTLVQSWFFLPVWGAPFALRSLRVLIATSNVSQERFGFFLRKRTTLAMETFLCTVATIIIVTLSQELPPYSRGASVTDAGPDGGACFMMMEWRFLLPFCILQMGIFGVLGLRLRSVDDLLNISSELRVNFMLYLLFLCPYFVLQLHYRFRTEQEVPTFLQLLLSAMVVLAMLNTTWASIGGLDEFLDAVGWERAYFEEGEGEASTLGPSSHGPSGGSVSAASVVGAAPRAAGVTRSDIRRWKKHYRDVPSIMRNANMAAAFGALANRFLCSESFNFLVSVTEYRAFTGMMGAGPGLQHMLFNDICKTFVKVNSEQEINISHDQRQDVLQYLEYRAFSSLRESERAEIFRDAEREVAQMLQLNLLATFHNSEAFTQTCAAVDVEEHVWDLEEKRALVGSDDSEDGDAADESRRPGGRRSRGGSVCVEMPERGGGVGMGLEFSARESHEDDASWRGSGSDTASWRGSGSALLSHVALSSSAVAPSS